MKSADPSSESGLPEFANGTVWLVSAGDGDRHHLSPLAAHALGTADAVIADPSVAQEILDLVKPPRYREAAVADRAIKRSIKLAQDGWRVVRLVEGDAIERDATATTNQFLNVRSRRLIRREEMHTMTLSVLGHSNTRLLSGSSLVPGL